MTDKYITSSQYREGLNSIKEYIDKSIPHIGYPVIFTLYADKVLEIYNSTNHSMEFDKPSSIDLNKEIIMTYNNKDVPRKNSPSDFISYDDNNITINFHIGFDINKNTNENKMVITIGRLNTNITSDLILKQREDKYLNNKYLKKDVAIQNSITIGNRLISNIGQYSFSNGNGVIASGDNSHAEGEHTRATNYNCHVEGSYSHASGSASHAEGNDVLASGDHSHAEGNGTIASGSASHAEGNNTIASSNQQHVQGKYNIEDTENKYAHIVGNGETDVTRSNAHTLDWNGNAWYAGDVQANNVPYTVSEKVVLTVPAATITEKKTEIDKATQERPAQINVTGTVAYDSTKSYYLKYNNKEYPAVYSTGMFYIAGDDCFCIIEFRNGSIVMEVVTLDTTNITDLQLIEKNIKKLDNKYVPNDLNVNNSITAGIRTGKIGEFSSSFGISCEASGDLSHAEGMFTTASGNYSHAEGETTTASGDYSHAEGSTTTSSGNCSHAEGETTTASGRSSHAECYNTTASGDYSHAEGMYTTALSDASHAEGSSTTASGFASHAEGDNTTASGDNSHVQGKYNIEDTENKYAHIVGNGSENNKSNAHTLDWDGNAWFAGKVTQEGTPTNDKDLVNKKYVDDKISNIPDAYTLLYPKEVDRTIAYYDIYDLPLGDYRIAQQDGIRTWNICVYVNNIRTQLFSTQNSRGFSFSKRINGTGTADGKSGKLITIDTYSMTTGGETYTWMVYDDGSVDVKNHKATILSAYTNTEFTPTKDYQPATKKYVDDTKASIVVPTKTSELTNDSNFLTKHQSLTGLATETYVNNKVAGIVNSAPETLDTLKELATSLGNDPNFATTVSNKIGNKVDKVDGMSLTHNDLTDELKANYDAAYKYSQAKHSYNDLTDKPTIPSIEGFATKEKPVFTGNISMERKEGSTIGGYSVAIGYETTASAYASHAEGACTVASGNQSHAEGEYTTASGYNSHAEGYKTIASNTLSHAEGNYSTSSGNCSHAEGFYTTASGDYSHAEGYNTKASSENQHVQGKYNIEDTKNKYAHIVGNGTDSTKSNAHTLDWNGNAWFAGKLTQEGTPTDDKDLITKKYFDDNKPTVPTKTSELTNDSNFLTEHQSLTKYATIEYVDSKLTTNYVSKEELTESTKPADTTTVKTTLNDILGGDYIE